MITTLSFLLSIIFSLAVVINLVASRSEEPEVAYFNSLIMLAVTIIAFVGASSVPAAIP